MGKFLLVLAVIALILWIFFGQQASSPPSRGRAIATAGTAATPTPSSAPAAAATPASTAVVTRPSATRAASGASPQSPAVAKSGGTSAGAPPVLSRPTPAPYWSVKADIEAICQRRDVKILSYKESGDIVEIQVKGRSRQAVGEILDDMMVAGILKDLFNDEMKYSAFMERGQMVHVAYYKMRASK